MCDSRRRLTHSFTANQNRAIVECAMWVLLHPGLSRAFISTQQEAELGASQLFNKEYGVERVLSRRCTWQRQQPVHRTTTHAAPLSPLRPVVRSQESLHATKQTDCMRDHACMHWIAPCYYQNRMHAPASAHALCCRSCMWGLVGSADSTYHTSFSPPHRAQRDEASAGGTLHTRRTHTHIARAQGSSLSERAVDRMKLKIRDKAAGGSVPRPHVKRTRCDCKLLPSTGKMMKIRYG